MTRTHKEVRFLEPAHRTAQVGTVDRKDLKLISLHAPDPARDVGGGSVPRARIRIPKLGEPRLLLPKVSQRAERNPGLERPFSAETGKHIAKHRHRYRHGGDSVQHETEFEQK